MLDTTPGPSPAPLYRTTESADPITHAEAAAVVSREAPGFKPTDVVDSHGVHLVYGEDYVRQAYVDPGSGRLLGVDNPTDGVMGFLYNLHLCALSCEEYAGYIPFLEKPAHLLGNEELTVGGLILAVTGLLLLLLAATGIVVWWPGIKRLARGLRVRRRSGSYAFNYDLHNVAGVATGGRPAEPVPFAGYLLLSVLAMPIGWAYARSTARGWDAAAPALAACARSSYQLATRFADAPLAYALSALAAAVYVIAAFALRTDRRALLAGAASLELVGVLGVGALTLADPAAFPDETVWSRFGQRYGFLPLALPVAALAWLRSSG